MELTKTPSGDDLVAALDALHARSCAALSAMFRLIADASDEVWLDWGARDMAHWLSLRYGISYWKASRWIEAARALEKLPRISEAFSAGQLDVDKVVELTRFASPADEDSLIEWAQDVSAACIRRRGDRLARLAVEQAESVERERWVSWWYYDEGKRFALDADLPAADGAVVARALERLAERIPVIPDGERPSMGGRRADALLALASVQVSQDQDPDRATIVIHTRLEDLARDDATCEVERDGRTHVETARRLLCHSRFQTVVETAAGEVVGVGRLTREPPPWMLRQLWHRDGGCTFPGCGWRSFTEAHHIRWWSTGGRTDLSNLTLACSFHHKLVHEYGWSIRRRGSGSVGWYRPDGAPFHAGPAPPANFEGARLQPDPEHALKTG